MEVIREVGPYPGYLYRPDDKKRYPAIIFLHGSEGGNGDFWYFPGQKPTKVGEDCFVSQFAKEYAKRGYVTYAISYFHAQDNQEHEFNVPSELKDIDLERITYGALKWLKKCEYVENKKVALFGVSRGAEQALILSSILSKRSESILPDLVIALSAPDIVFGAFLKEYAEATIMGKEPDWKNEKAWKFGKASPEVGSPIEVETITPPMLISYGSQDKIWGPFAQPNNIVKRLKEFDVEHLLLEFKNCGDSNKVFNEVVREDINNLVVNYLDEGHSNIDKQSRELEKKLLNWFIDKTLK